jgi:hypothetical protein
MNLWFNSYETNKEWSDKFVHTVYVDSYFDIPFPSFGKYTNEVGVLFVDAAPGEIRKELIDKYNIKTDRDLIKQLGITEEDKGKLFAWIRYQCAFSYREGFDNGQDELKYAINDLLTPTR